MAQMRMQGVVAKWNAEKGFGFIRTPQSSQQVFFHIREFSSADRSTPLPGQPVEFETIHVGGKGPRALAVRPVSASVPVQAPRTSDRRAPRHSSATTQSPRYRRPGSGATTLLPLMVVWATAIVWASAKGLLPRWGIPVLGLVNLATFYLYWWDKYAATKGHWRTTESSLQLWGLAGGWPSAWLAQQLLRHKSSKESFRSVFHACVGLHCAALAAWLLWINFRPGGGL